VVVGRQYARLSDPQTAPVGPIWRDTRVALPEGLLAGGRFRNVFTDTFVEPAKDGTVAMSDVCSHLPVALLELAS
jgi:maltooligosyltrehalose synthase